MGRNDSGRWVSFPANTLRSWYHPTTLETRYTLVEPERTQLLSRTRQPTLTAIQSSVSIDSAVQTPFGSGSTLYVPSTENTAHGWNLFFGTDSHGAALVDNATIALSAVMRPTGIYTNVTFLLLNKTGIYSSVRVSLEGNGSVISSIGVISAEVRPDTDNFYAIEIVNNYGTGTAIPSFNAGFHNQAGAQVFAGNGTAGFYLAYIGAEAGTEATSPIINAGTSVLTRPADILSATTEWVSSGAKTFGLTYVPMGKASATVLDIAGPDRITIANGPASVSLAARVGSEQNLTISAAAPPSRTERTVVAALAPGAVTLAQDGIIVGSDNPGTKVPDFFSEIRVGDSVSGGSGGPLLIKLIKYWSDDLQQESLISWSNDLTQDVDTDYKMSVTVQPVMTIPSSSTKVFLLVLLSGDPSGTTVSYSTVDETAVAGTDYIGISGQIIIPPGDTSAVISVDLMPRGSVEDKTFRIVLTGAKEAEIANGVCLVRLLRKRQEWAPASPRIAFGATLPADVSLTRASPSWTRDSTGVWTQVAANSYRRHYVAAGSSGLLIEGASEQCLFDSVDPAFTATGGTRTIDTSEVTPTGSRHIKFRESTATSQHMLSLTIGPATGVTPVGAFTTTVIIRPVVRRYFSLFIRGADNMPRTVSVDLTGQGVSTAVPAGLSVLVERDAFRTDWYSISISQPQSVSAGVPVTIDLRCSLQDGSTSFTGTASNGFDLCHVQVEPGTVGSSPIIVSGATDRTVRAVDIVKAAGTWHQRQSYSLGMRFRRLKETPAIQRLWMAKDTSSQTMGVSIVNGEIVGDIPGNVPILTFQSIGTGARTVWQLPDSGTDGAAYTVIVVVDGLLQSSTGYTLAANTLTFSEPPPLNATLEVRGLPAENTVLSAVGTGNQTIWPIQTVTGAGTSSYLISLDGVVQLPDSYTMQSGQLVFTQAPPSGSAVSVRMIGPSVLGQEITSGGTAEAIVIAQNAAAGSASLLISIDGLLQAVSSYTTSGIGLTFSQAAPVNAPIDVRFLPR